MKYRWDRLPKEVAYLYNPAFCARLLYVFVEMYQDHAQKGAPISLMFLVLPIVLNCQRDSEMSHIKTFAAWASKYPSLSATFPRLAKSYIGIGKDSIEFLIASGLCSLDQDGTVCAKANSGFRKKSQEGKEHHFWLRAKNLGRLMADAGSDALIYSYLGVRP